MCRVYYLPNTKIEKKVSRIFGATISVELENFIKSIKNTVRVQVQNSLIVRRTLPTGSLLHYDFLGLFLILDGQRIFNIRCEFD